MKNFLLHIQYDGTNYSGWQTQENAPSIQESLEKAIFRAIGEKVSLNGAGRTDAGVHAICQCASFESNTTIDAFHLGKAINTKVPRDIDVYACREVPMDFHARFSPHRKTYTYTILNCPNVQVLNRLYEWHVRKPLDVAKMQQAAAYLVGEHDFTSFMHIAAIVKSAVRTVYDLTVTKDGERIRIAITANGFVYNMVRIIVGTLVKVGLGKMDPEELPRIVAAKERTLSGMTAPAKGLCLTDIQYDSLY